MGHMITLCLTFGGNSQTFQQQLHHFTFLRTIYKRSIFFTSSTLLILFSLIHLNMCVCVCVCVCVSLNIHWKDWCWSWSSNTLAIWCKELTHWKRSWCWARLKVGGEGDDRWWDGWMASLTPLWWTWVWVSSGSWWWTGKPGVLQSMWSQRVAQDWVTELNWWLH